MSERVAHTWLAGILVTFVLLASAYAYVTPTLEAPDEIYHYDYIRSLVNTGRPPVLKPGGGRGFGHHAPLYYAYGALVSFWVGENDLQVWPERHNPFFGYRFGDVGRDNKNLYLHPDDDTFGRSDTWLGIRVVRWASVVLGAITVWAVYRAGREVFPDQPEIPLGAAGLAAFIPEFLFVSGAVNDDNGSALWGALALWAMMRILRKGPTLRRCVGLGLALGLGWLSKLTVVSLVLTAGFTLAVACWRSWREALRWGLIVFGVTGLIIAPWLVRQILLYGDPTGTAREMTEWGLREQPVTLANLGPDLYWLRTSFWGRLGYNQIPFSDWIYDLLDVISLFACLGVARLAIRHMRSSPGLRRFALVRRAARGAVAGLPSQIRDRSTEPVSSSNHGGLGQAVEARSRRSRQFAVLTAAFLLTFGPMTVRRFLRPMPNFGRYLFPVLAAIALLLFAGLAAWLPRRRHPLLALGVVAAMLALGVAGLFCFLAPAYARPPVYAPRSAPESSYHLDWVYLEGDRPLARLHGYDVDGTTAQVGQTLRVTLYWEVLRETPVNYALFTQLFGREGAKVGQRDTYPGLGHYPTSFWQAGQVIVDEVPIPVAPDAIGPSRLRLDVGLYDRETGRRLAVVDGVGDPVGTATAGWLKLGPSGGTPQPAHRTTYTLGDAIALTGYDLEGGHPLAAGEAGAGWRLTLYWASLAPLERDYTVFVHLIGPGGVLMAQADGPPAGGDYPTSLWAPGETIADQRIIPTESLPPGAYDLRVGMYLLETGERLPAFDAGGARLPADAIPLTTLELRMHAGSDGGAAP